MPPPLCAGVPAEYVERRRKGVETMRCNAVRAGRRVYISVLVEHQEPEIEVLCRKGL